MKALLETLLDLVFPNTPLPGEAPQAIEKPFCERCGVPFDFHVPDSQHCTRCEARDWHFVWARAGYRAKGQVLETIHQLKYHQQFHCLKQVCDWLEESYVSHIQQYKMDGLVPVPLYPTRERERGFNQAWELARELGKRQKLPLVPCLERFIDTKPQASKNREERMQGMQKAFGLKRRFDVQGQHLLLIDDVFTTGATAEACAKALHEAGAASVAVLTVARA